MPRRKKATTSRDIQPRTTSQPRARRGLGGLSVADLQAEIQRRQRSLVPLQRRRAKLANKLQDLDRQIEMLGGQPNGFVKRGRGRPRGSGASIGAGMGAGMGMGGRRPRNEMNLVDSLSQVLQGKTMSVTDVTQAVQDAGYRTSSSTFRTIVNQALLSHPDRFKKVARGMYTAK